MKSKWERKATDITDDKEDAVIDSVWMQKALIQRQPHGVGGSFAKLGWLDVLKKAAENAPPSAYQYGKNIYLAIRHPVETGKAVGKIAIGAAEKLIPKEQEYEEYYDNFVNALAERYGTVEALKETIANDPVGVLADVSSVVLPFAQLGKMPRLAKFAAMADPLSGSLNVARKLGSALIPRGVPSKLYESAVKLSTAMPVKLRKKIVQTALREQIMPTYNGLLKLDKNISAINDNIVNLIEESVSKGKTIPIDRLFQNFDSLKKKILEASGEPMKGFAGFENVEKEIRLANKKLSRKTFTPLEAQKMKQRIYKELDREYAKVSLHPIKAEAQMAVAKNLKEAIEEIIPEIKQLNASEAELIELKKAITRATERISNRDLLSLGTTAKAAGGGVVAGAPGMLTGLALGLLDSQPLIKSKLSLVLAKIKSKGIVVRPTPLGIRLGLYQAGKTQQGEQ